MADIRNVPMYVPETIGVSRCAFCGGRGVIDIAQPWLAVRPHPCTDCRGRGVVCTLCRKPLEACADSFCKNARLSNDTIQALHVYLSPLKDPDDGPKCD